jgi:hypothetical protein
MRSALKRLIELEDQNGPNPAIANSWTDAIADARTALLKTPGQTNPIDEDEIVDLESSLWVTARSLDHFGQCHVVPPALLFRAAELISKQDARIDELESLVQESTDIGHVEWIYNRLIHVYNESPNVDYMLRLRSIIEKNGTALAESGGEGPSLADVRQLCVDNELSLFVDSSDFDTVVVAISEIVRTALTSWGNLVTSPATESGVDKWYPDFADWLERKMPEGTVIGDPLWWASKIADRIICTPALLQQVSIPTVPEPKRVEGVGGLVEELELMVNRAADARQFGDAHFLSRAVTLLQQLQTEQL